MRKVVLVIVLVLACIMGVVAEPIQVTANNLVTMFNNDPEKAKETYLNKEVELTIKVSKVGTHDDGRPFILAATDPFGLTGVYIISESGMELLKFLKVRQGTTVTVRGTCIGSMMLYVGVDDAIVK